MSVAGRIAIGIYFAYLSVVMLLSHTPLFSYGIAIAVLAMVPMYFMVERDRDAAGRRDN